MDLHVGCRAVHDKRKPQDLLISSKVQGNTHCKAWLLFSSNIRGFPALVHFPAINQTAMCELEVSLPLTVPGS